MLRNNREYGELIRHARGQKGWTQTDLSKRLGYSQAWVAHLETGRLKNISEGIQKELAKILGLNQRKRGLGQNYFRAEEMMTLTSEIATNSMAGGACHRTTIKKPIEQVESERLGKKILTFSVEGPWDVPHEKGPGGWVLLPEKAQWIESLREAKGVYIFAIKVGESYLPIYVGKATKQGFAKEALNGRNLHLYQKALAKDANAVPVMFFIIGPKNPGVPNGKAIRDIEKLFIAVAWLKNPDLLNIHHTPRNWLIRGVTGN